MTKRAAWAAGLVAAALLAAPSAGGTAGAPAQYLALAKSGVAAAHSYWWNLRLRWYDAGFGYGWDPTTRPLARLWDAFPLFEAIDAVAIADPGPSELAAVRSFANGAERYYDPNVLPVGGYAWYPGMKSAGAHIYFDDNGWFLLGFLDAYRATGDRRYLADAERAFRFIVFAGWDAWRGGVWWDTHHLHKTSEPLAAEIYGGFALARITGDGTYATVAERLLAWANANVWNASSGLYGRDAHDHTVMDYVEGMMIGARLEQCRLTGDQRDCRRAEQLAAASMRAFSHNGSWTPAADAIYLRFMLDLYHADGKERWHRLALDNTARALENARGLYGLFLRRWDGTTFPYALLESHAATISLFAWIAAAAAVSNRGARLGASRARSGGASGTRPRAGAA